MTLKEKFNSIDQSRITADQKSMLGKMQDVTKDFTLENKAVNDKVEGALDKMIASFKEKMPDAIKTTTKVVVPKTEKSKKTTKVVSKTTTPKRTVMSVAKEIRKEGESWADAQKRAKGMIKDDKAEVSEVVKTELDRIKKFISGRKELQGISGTDIPRDSARQAKPRGRRISKDGNVYYENRENRTDRLAPNYPKDAPFLEEGGYLTDPTFGTFQNQVLENGAELKHGGFRKDRSTKFIDKNYEVIVYPDKLEILVILTNEDTIDQDGLDASGINWRKEDFGYSMEADNKAEFNKAIKVILGVNKRFSEGGYLTDPTFGSFQNQVLENGGDFQAGVYAKGGGFRFKNGRKYDVGSNWTNDHNQFDKGAEHEVQYRKRSKYELGGTMATDLAGHTGGGDGGLNAGMPLDGFSNTGYTGLVGETGAMSSGEMFMNGGGLPSGAEQHYVNYYLGEGASQGIYKAGGSIPNNYAERTPKDVWDNWTERQKRHFLVDHKNHAYKYGNLYDSLEQKQELITTSYSDLPRNLRLAISDHVETGQYKAGGILNANERYVLEIKGLTGLRKEAIENYIAENNLSDNDVLNIVIGLGRKQLKGSDVASAVVGKKGNALSKEVIQFAKDNKGMKLEEGGNIDAFTLRMVKGTAGKPDEAMTEPRSVQFVKGGAVSFRERRNKYLETLGVGESKVWDKIGAESGSEIRSNPKMLKSYAEGVEEMLQKKGVGKGSFDQEDYDFYTDENWHLFNEFLVWNNYYEPDMTKAEKAWRLKYSKDGEKSQYVSDPEVITLNSTKSESDKKYIPNADIESVTVKKAGKKVTYSGKDVLNGANILKNGGGIEDKASYFSKNNIVSVELKNGKSIKPANGYWVKKDAKPISKMETGGGIGIEEDIDMSDDNKMRVRKPAMPERELTRKEWAEKHNAGAYEYMDEEKMMFGGDILSNLKNIFTKDVTYKTDDEGNFFVILKPLKDQRKYENIEDEVFYKMPEKYLEKDDVGDFFVEESNVFLPNSQLSAEEIERKFGVKLSNKAKEIYTDKNKAKQKSDVEQLLRQYKEAVKNNNYAYASKLKKLIVSVNESKKFEGGGKTTFREKSTAIARKFEGKRVEPKYQKDYGKVYSKEEAKKVGDKITGSIVAKEKMMSGGQSKKGAKGGIMVLAKKIRKDGESWQDALKRAGQQLK